MFREATEEDLAPRPGRAAPAGQAGFWEVMGAAWDAERIETDWHNYMGRRYADRYDEAWSALTSALGEDGARQALEQRGVTLSERREGRRPLDQGWNTRNGAALLEAVQGINADLYGSFPATPQNLLGEINAEVRAEYEDAANTLAMGGRGAGLSEFLGRGGAAATDEVSLLTLPFGFGSGSIGRVILAEAALGAAAEAAVLPRMYEQSERVGTPEPNPVAQVAMGAVIGGAIGGVGEGLRRAFVYSQLRRQISAIPDGLSPSEAQAAIEAATQALDAGETLPPILREEGPEVPFAPRDEEDAALVGDGGQQRLPTEEEIDQARRNIFEQNPELNRNRPTMDYLRQSGGIQWTRVNPNTGERELSPIASELQGMGISQRQLLGLVRRDGMADVDNIVASEFADGGTPRLRTDDTGTYLDRDALIEAIVQEAGGRPAYRTAEAEAAAARLTDLEDNFARIRRDLDAASDAEGVPEMEFNGPFIARRQEGEDELARADMVERTVNDFADQMDTPPSQEVRYDAMGYLAETGGNVEDALTRAMMDAIERDFDAGSQAPTARGAEALPAGSADARAGRPERAAAEDAGIDQGVARVDGPGSERTAAGDQLLTPGTAPVSQRQRLEAQQNAPMRGGDALANDGLFDLNARLQRDMFDDPDNASMQAKYDEREAELREAWDGFEDVEVELEGETVTARQLLKDLEADRAHLQAIETCGWTGRGGPDVVS
jgi:hypothetical protein